MSCGGYIDKDIIDENFILLNDFFIQLNFVKLHVR